jgi:hypothetical protein
MRHLGLVLACAGFLGTVSAVEAPPSKSPEALDLLRRADEAIAKTEAVRVHSTFTPTGPAAAQHPSAEGVTVLAAWKGSVPLKFWGEATLRRPGSEEPERITGGGDGERFFLLDHRNRAGYEDMDRNVMGQRGRILMSLSMMAFAHPTPGNDAQNGERVELAGSEPVAGEPCDQVRVVYPAGKGETIWSIARKDSLPRRRVIHLPSSQGESEVVFEVHKLEIDPIFDPAVFRMQLPEGYSRSGEFAP